MARNLDLKKEDLTTGEVARLCRCSSQYVADWIDRGELEGHRLRSQDASRRSHRRVSKAALRRFLAGRPGLMAQLTPDERAAIGLDAEPAQLTADARPVTRPYGGVVYA